MIAVRISQIGVDGLAVSRHDAAHKISRAHAAFNLKGMYTGLDEFRNIAVHAHVLQCELVRAGTISVEDFPGLLIDELISPAAWLQAAAAIAALSEDDTGMDALSAFGHAHIAMHEVFDFDAGTFFEKAELRKRHLTSDDNAGDAIFLELLDCMLVMCIHHDRGMQRNPDVHLMHELHDSKILDKDSIWLDFIQIGKILFQGGNFLVADQVVQCDIKAYTMFVGIGNSFFQHSVVKIRIAAVHAHIEVLAAKINSISTGFDSSLQGFPGTSRCK